MEQRITPLQQMRFNGTYANQPENNKQSFKLQAKLYFVRKEGFLLWKLRFKPENVSL